VVDVLNKHATAIFSVETFYFENGGAEQSNIDPNCCENLNIHIKNSKKNLQMSQK
jgi:hypothetical protein